MAVGDLRRIDVHHKHTRHWLWYVTAISFVTGALLASCLRTQREWRKDLGIGVWRPEIIAEHLKASREEANRLREELQVQRDRATALEQTLAQGGRDKELINEELQKYKMLMGLVELEGPGITMRLDDSTLRSATNDPEEIESLILHDYDLQRVVNELRVAGAEAISLNGQRIVERTAIRCVGSVAQVNNVPIGTPYEITAIGDPQVLRSGLTIRGGIIDWLKTLGFPVDLKAQQKVRVPAYTGPIELRHASPPPTPKPAATLGGGEKR
jgi:uncharacterized protein YlxW (UPF0749 family)